MTTGHEQDPHAPWALVTGAAGDLGSAIAEGLAADGLGLALWDLRTWVPAFDTADHAAGADAVEIAAIDVTDDQAVRAGLDDLVARRGAPRVVVANAGVQGEFVAVHRYPIADARRVLEVNVIGVFTVLAAAAAAMQGHGGSIVLTASMAGVGGAPNMPAYSASKAAVIALAKSAAKDLAPFGIRVNAVSPAFIGPGAMWDRQVELQAAAGSQYYATDPETVARQMIELVPLRRYGSPGEVADVVRWLAGERSSYVTGQNIEISGGSV